MTRKKNGNQKPGKGKYIQQVLPPTAASRISCGREGGRQPTHWGHKKKGTGVGTRFVGHQKKGWAKNERRKGGLQSAEETTRGCGFEDERESKARSSPRATWTFLGRETPAELHRSALGGKKVGFGKKWKKKKKTEGGAACTKKTEERFRSKSSRTGANAAKVRGGQKIFGLRNIPRGGGGVTHIQAPNWRRTTRGKNVMPQK